MAEKLHEMYQRSMVDMQTRLNRQETRTHALEQVVKQAMGLLSGNPTIYAMSNEAAAWQREADARQAWRARVNVLLEQES